MKDVNVQHKSYEKMLPNWIKCRHIANGSEEVKEQGVSFLPMLTDQTAQDYYDYKNRALFFEGTGRTVEGLLGMMFAKEPVITEPNDFLDRCTPGFETSKDFLKDISKEVIITGRVGLMADMTSSGKAYLTTYCAENVINWRVSLVEGVQVLDFVVLKEELEEYTGYKRKIQDSYRVLYLEEGTYKQALYVHTEDKSEEFKMMPGYPIMPVKGGKPLTSIPFYFINSTGAKPQPDRPPLAGLVNANIAHYMNSADLEHGRHFTGLPTPWAAGFGLEDDTELSIGSQTAWISSSADARAGYLEFTGQGLQSLENGLKEKSEAMVILGARFLEAPKASIESGISQSLKKQGENSILANISDSVSDSVSKALKFAADWGNEPEGEYKIEISKEFTVSRADPQLITALISAMQSGLLSTQLWFYYLKRNDLVPDGVTVEDEQNNLEKQESARFVIPQ